MRYLVRIHISSKDDWSGWHDGTWEEAIRSALNAVSRKTAFRVEWLERNAQISVKSEYTVVGPLWESSNG